MSPDDLANIVTTGDIADRLGVAPNRVGNWTRRHPSFPKPIRTFGKAAVYWWPDVAGWALAYGIEQ